MSALFGNDFPCCTTDPEDTAVSHADEPQPPMPAEGAPHAYVAIKRTHSLNADRPEWETDPHLIPAHEVDELIYWNTQPDVSLLPIGPDGDTGTRAIVEPRRIEDPAELTSLPYDTLIVAHDARPYVQHNDGWLGVLTGDWTAHAHLPMPVTVLWTPAEVSDGE